MRAGTATILTFPGRRCAAADLELGQEHRARAGSPVSTGRCPALLRRLARTGWAPNLAAAAPFFLSPKAGGPHDLAGTLIAVLTFVLAQELAPRLLGSVPARRRETAMLAFALLVGALAVGPGMVAAAAVFLLLEMVRLSLRRAGPLAVLLAASGVVLRLDAGAAVFGLELAPALLAAGLMLGLLLALPREVLAERRRTGLWRELAPLALVAGILALYVAGLASDPWVQRTGGAWPLLSVPLVLLGLVRLWRNRQHAGEPDLWLAATGVAWAVLMGAVLPTGGL